MVKVKREADERNLREKVIKVRRELGPIKAQSCPKIVKFLRTRWFIKSKLGSDVLRTTALVMLQVFQLPLISSVGEEFLSVKPLLSQKHEIDSFS